MTISRANNQSLVQLQRQCGGVSTRDGRRAPPYHLHTSTHMPPILTKVPVTDEEEGGTGEGENNDRDSTTHDTHGKEPGARCCGVLCDARLRGANLLHECVVDYTKAQACTRSTLACHHFKEGRLHHDGVRRRRTACKCTAIALPVTECCTRVWCGRSGGIQGCWANDVHADNHYTHVVCTVGVSSRSRRTHWKQSKACFPKWWKAATVLTVPSRRRWLHEWATLPLTPH
ncbi:hypothetical protein TcWFU_001731 [Taenia crassiceps]|uniref:Uncharacterized protein n=1 Tax=Taenia crassiceps TaxID=6207 RepID=A0ABR4Q5H7_9CEST